MPQHGADVEWICVTDGAPHPDAEAAEGWTLVCEPHNGVHPNRAAKRAKFAPWEYTAPSCSIWVDASFRVVSDRFAVDVLALADPIAQFVHPWRDCLFEEAAESGLLPKYRGEPVNEQGGYSGAGGEPEGSESQKDEI